MMPDDLLNAHPRLRAKWRRYWSLFSEKHVPARSVLLDEGEIPRNVFYVKEGCLRANTGGRGREITFQFFFENDFVASIESFRSARPSPIRITSVEPTTLMVLPKQGFEKLLADFPELRDFMMELAFRRFSDYTRLFISYLRDTPRQRYAALLRDQPHIIQRVPQRYIASYLGITPVSLSRIRRAVR